MQQPEMASSLAYLTIALAGAGFLLWNGPLLVVTKVRVFSRGSQSPTWLEAATCWASRVGGFAMLVSWLWVVTQGSVLAACLLGITFLIGAFLLANGPVRLITPRRLFARGREAPLWLQKGVLWFNRVVGSGTMLCGLFLGFRYLLKLL